MKKMLIIADDLTGALDTGVRFAEKNCRISVLTGSGSEAKQDFEGFDLCVVNTESRHLDPEAAYERVFAAAKCGISAGADYLYKKTDSALRGNIGSELAALRDAAGRTLHFVPAYPELGRVTIGGVQYADGVELAESSFKNDPVNPMKISGVRDILRATSGGRETGNIIVYDCGSEAEMGEIAVNLTASGISTFAGCAGLAGALAEMYEARDTSFVNEGPCGSFPVLSGSNNVHTKAQIGYAVNNFPERFIEYAVTRRELISGEVSGLVDFISKNRGKHVMAHTFSAELTANEAAGGTVGAYFARTALMLGKACPAIMFVGGDTLMSFIRQGNIGEIRPLQSMAGGSALSEAELASGSIRLISKSGGFGEEDCLVNIADAMDL